MQLRSVAFSTFSRCPNLREAVLVHLYRRETELEGSLFLSAAQSHRYSPLYKFVSSWFQYNLFLVECNRLVIL